ncbi:MAG: hypothetical protein R3C15_17995 [Thermoleophilia bacterium]
MTAAPLEHEPVPETVDVPLLDARGLRTGRTVRVPSPPPAAWRGEDGEALELTPYLHLERFGCGCIREQRLGYAPGQGAEARA